MNYDLNLLLIFMKIKEIKAKSILVKTGLGADFVINPYIGCGHGCKYCYARFMKRFTNNQEEWGEFIDVKINAPELIPKNKEKYNNKSILMSSTTDPYQPIERKYKITRKILEKLISIQPNLEILTKSDLILRDLNLLKQFKNCTVTFSFSILDENVRKQLELRSVSMDRRIKALKKIHETKIRTVVFISPIFPGFTDWKEIINKTKNFVNEFWFENLNLYPSIRSNIYEFLRKNKPKLVEKYKEIYSGNSSYWDKEEKKIRDYCKKNKIKCKIYFHH